jgi:HTH-like domain
VLREQGVQAAPRTYRAWKRNAASARAVSDAVIVGRLRQLRTGGPDGRPLPEVLYGRRKMTAWLARTGVPGVSKHTVDRLMRQEGRGRVACVKEAMRFLVSAGYPRRGRRWPPKRYGTECQSR